MFMICLILYSYSEDAIVNFTVISFSFPHIAFLYYVNLISLNLLVTCNLLLLFNCNENKQYKIKISYPGRSYQKT